MPYAGSDFPNVETNETVTYAFDFSGALAGGETISSASFTASVSNDSNVYDPSASSIATGAAGVSGTVVSQQFTGMVDGVRYLITGTVVTSLGNHLNTYSHFYTDIPH